MSLMDGTHLVTIYEPIFTKDELGGIYLDWTTLGRALYIDVPCSIQEDETSHNQLERHDNRKEQVRTTYELFTETDITNAIVNCRVIENITGKEYRVLDNDNMGDQGWAFSLQLEVRTA